MARQTSDIVVAQDSGSTDPWASGGASGSAAPDGGGSADPWGGRAGATPDGGGADWLSQAPAPPADPGFDIFHPFQHSVIPLEGWVEHFLDYVVAQYRFIFQGIRWPVDGVLSGVEHSLTSVPAPIMLLFIALLAWQAAGWRLGVGALLSLTFVGLIGAWDETMVTLSLVLTSVLFCIIIGLPMGVLLAGSNTAARIIRPILDAMQTTPAFVYLVPIVMLFGIGNVPGVVVTIIFALPPVIRLTNLGIRQVPGDLVEAARSFGASGPQLLFKVQLPLAMPTIMAGVNQTLMLALSMVVIASMIAVGGLGQMVLRGIGRLDMGLATVGGIGIVLLAIIIDRMTQALGISKRDRGNVAWYDTGPVGLVRRLTAGRAQTAK
ncbi:glycine betaine/L-proline ABC transporter permease ProW [Roseospira marina]|uniref:Glycine betaine/L-proline ABC transporter permease ProW n=1 Tax=Roseospira marina TaxID=140057 RepID=A0A5M6IBP7_9PROT|nr:glycine betaine/L-proline ABC transporter permease ProW [Roseospira marina]KAA5605159.1 glycine betaine/L-proline ABC transporter permease ProW [Roseospira marina]MBB4314916.1 glycine betaine/proline transport system permease protein [Roseospira marina]MBB5087916.1 glycine betaine/proline transport system permease protein [Roseospira marina]